MNNPNQVLADWAAIFDAFLAGDAQTAENYLAGSDFALNYQLVHLTDGMNEYLMLREVLNNNYFDDNGTVDEQDDVTGSFDLGWGLFVMKLNPAPANLQVVLEVVHPSSDFAAPYVALDAFISMDAACLFINGASRNIAWSGPVYDGGANSLSDPSRNANTPFHEAHKAAVDMISDEIVIQVHSYNAYPQHDGFPSIQLSAERENNTHPNAPLMNWDHIDLISLTPDPVLQTGPGWGYSDVSISDFYTAYYPGGYRYRGYLEIANNIDLPGTLTNNQMVYCHLNHDFVNDRENWLHMEMDEFPDVVRLDDVDILTFYKYTSLGPRVPTWENYTDIVTYYRPVFAAIAQYMNFTPAVAAAVNETDAFAEFFMGDAPNCGYDNWVSHISEGIADPGYNDYGPVELDRQTEGFGNFQLIPDDTGGDSLLNNWRQVFDAFLQGDALAVQSLLTGARLGDIYEIVSLADGADDYLILREKLNSIYYDDNGTGDSGDDVTGAFDYGWGLYVINLDALRPQIVIEVPHPCDDYTASAIGLDAFRTTGAGLLFVTGAGREVEWTEAAPYYNSKSLSDPTRNSRHPFQVAHEAAVDAIQDELVIQIHSYDTDAHLNSYQTEVSTADDYYPNQPVMDVNSYFDLISLTPETPVPANTIGIENHAAVRVDQYYAVYYGGGYSWQDTYPISNYIEQPGYSGNVQMLYSHIGHDAQNGLENWLHLEHDEFPNVITENILSFYNAGLIVPTYANFANVVDYFNPLYTAIDAYYEGPNTPPAWTDVPAPISVDEGVLVEFTVTGSDPDGDPVIITLDPDGIPGGYVFADSGNGTASFSWQTAAGDGGAYTATFTISDGSLTDVAAVPITVIGAPEPQTAYASGEQAVAGTVQGTYSNTVDSDNSYEVITERQSGGRPANRHSYLEHIWTFQLNGFDLVLNAEAYHSANQEGDDFILAGSFDGQSYTDLVTVSKTSDDNNEQTTQIAGTATGAYYVKVTDTDRTSGNSSLDSFYMDKMYITYMTGPVPNQPPVWTDVPESITANEGELVQFPVVGSDPENDTLTISFDRDGLPDGYEFTDNGNGTASFTWQTNAGDAGDYTASFTLSDGEYSEVAAVPIHIDVPPEPGIMFVGNIDLSLITIRKNNTAQGIVTIIDGNDAPVSGVTVSIAWSGLVNANDQDLTDDAGNVTFLSNNVRGADGWFILTVTGATKDEWTYDSDQNVETADSVGAGNAAGWSELALRHGTLIPGAVMLDPAYPNPFNEQTRISFGLPESGNVRISVYDQSGRLVGRLFDGSVSAGWHSTAWAPYHLSNGRYFIRLETENTTKVMQSVLLR